MLFRLPIQLHFTSLLIASPTYSGSFLNFLAYNRGECEQLQQYSRDQILIGLYRYIVYRRTSNASASCLPSTQLASSVFTLGTTAVLLFYTLMIVAPKAEVVSFLLE